MKRITVVISAVLLALMVGLWSVAYTQKAGLKRPVCKTECARHCSIVDIEIDGLQKQVDVQMKLFGAVNDARQIRKKGVDFRFSKLESRVTALERRR